MPSREMSGETGLCVAVLITEYSVGKAVIDLVVGSRVPGLWVELFTGPDVTAFDEEGVDDFAVV
jgi:hypothetical protein